MYGIPVMWANRASESNNPEIEPDCSIIPGKKKAIIFPSEILGFDRNIFCRLISCTYEGKNINSYLDHIKESHNGTCIPCPYCYEVFVRDIEFSEHMMCHGPNLFACDKETCHWYSFQKTKVIKHTKDTHDQLDSNVKIIRQNFEKELNLFFINSNHFSRELSADTQFICPFCYYQNVDFKDMKNHIYAELYYARFQCKICNAKMCSRKITMAHFLENHDYHHIECEVDRNPEIECLTACFLTREIQENYLQHVHNRYVVENILSLLTEYKCHCCNACFSNVADWHFHSQCHATELFQVYTCYYCSSKFPQIIQLKCHTHKEHSTNSIKCILTENEFRKQKITRKLQNEKIKILKDILGPYLKRKSKEVGNSKSTQYKYYKCAHCKFNDTFRSNVEHHMRISHNLPNIVKIENAQFLKCINSSRVSSSTVEEQSKSLYACCFCITKASDLAELQEHKCDYFKSSDLFFYFPDPKWEFSEKDIELFDCAYCSLSQENFFHLKRHCKNFHSDVPFKVRIVGSKDSPSVQCHHCDLKFISEEHKKIHCLFNHPEIYQTASKDERPEKRKQRNSDTTILPAKIRHTNVYNCSHCNQYFFLYIGIVLHYAANHPGMPIKFLKDEPDPYDTSCIRINCDFCECDFEPLFMDGHILLYHPDCFVCLYCSLGRSSPNSLIIHSKIFHKEKPARVMEVKHLDDGTNVRPIYVSINTFTTNK